MSGPNAPPQIGQQDYRTPPDFLAAVLRRLGRTQFDVDVACTTRDCVGTTGVFHDTGANALELNWSTLAEDDSLAWCNHPYSHSAKFARKWAAPGLQVAVLTPVALGTHWWLMHVHGIADVLWAGRLVFHTQAGTPVLDKHGRPSTINRDVCLLHYNGLGPSGRYLLEDWRDW